MKKILGHLRPYWLGATSAFVIIIVVTIADLAIPRLVQRIVDQGVTPRDMGMIWRTAGLMLGIAAFSAFFSIINTLISVRVAQRFARDLRSSIFRKIQFLSFGNLDQFQTGQLLVRLTSDVTTVQMSVQMFMRLFTRAPLLLVGSAALMIATSPRLTLLVSVLIGLMAVILGIFVKYGPPMFRSIQKKLDRLNTLLQENLSGVRVVKAFVRADHENQRFAVANEDLTQQTIKVFQLFGILFPTLVLFMNLGMVGVVWFGGIQATQGDISVGAIMAFVNYLMTTLFPLMMISMMVNQLAAAKASGDRILEVLDAQQDVQDRPDARPLESLQGRVAFEHISFSYDGEGAEAVLSDINLIAEPGQTVAILGATGSGKSSLVHLIPRFYDVNDGRITIDGTDIRDMTQESLRKRIGIAMQEAVLFTGTIRDNIRYGQPTATDDEVIAAAKAAQAHDFISEFPEGYDTLVGQRGVNLSGGQKQRISIARALLVRPRILILDDSTSSVDVETEIKIESALEELMRDSTSFVIAQRVSTVLNADKIIVLEGGHIAAEGTHDELLATSPIYQDIYNSQLGGGLLPPGEGLADIQKLASEGA